MTTPLKNSNTQSQLESWAKTGKVAFKEMGVACDELRALAESAAQAEQLDLYELVETLLALIDLAEMLRTDGEKKQAQTVTAFVGKQLPIAIAFIQGNEFDDLAIQNSLREAHENWGEHLELIRQSDFQADKIEPSEQLAKESDSSEINKPSAKQIDAMLAVLGQRVSEPGNEPSESKSDKASQTQPSELASATDPTKLPQAPEQLSISEEVRDDIELREAYLDDANRCLSAMEQVVLQAEEQANTTECVLEFCRQLHTLKGASASVGLSDLAKYLHEVEEWLGENNQDLEVQVLLDCVDSVRQQIGMIENPDAAQQDLAANKASGAPDQPNGTKASSRQVAKPRVEIAQSFASNEASVRVRASQLDKLMDMLAELIVLRNQRDSQLGQLNDLNNEITRCSHRLAHFREEHLQWTRESMAPHSNTGSSDSASNVTFLGNEPTTANAIAEVKSDLHEIARGIKNIYKPIVNENQAISQFIRHFRQELIQLRRVPMVGLFQKLQRSARDAAKVENKNIQVKLVGQNVGLEQSLQEQLFEPLLHLVRNAVGHGIEDEETRRQGGKNPAGTITLQAKSTANLLVISIVDDGRGLDYDALRRRGYERGLLSPGHTPTTRELAQLIFHPGFSTRDQASEVAGRGIGMDVVAGAINQLQGRIEIDSHPGSGTTMRVSIPLKNGIEHMMIFRSQNQLFGLPMQSVAGAFSKSKTETQNTRTLELSYDRGLQPAQPTDQQQVLILKSDEGTRVIGLVVDEVVGPAEIVARGLPRPIADHPYLAGLTMSGKGETTLLLDGHRLAEIADRIDSIAIENVESPANDSGHQKACRVLIADDSLSARKALAKRLRRRGGFEITEADDGMAALEILRRAPFDLLMTDLDMPRLTGMELLVDLQHDSKIDITKVVVSNRDKPEIRQRALDLGASAFINKPVTDESLAEVLDAVFETTN